MINSIGTIIRIIFIFLALVFFWFSLANVPYLILISILGVKFSLTIASMIFGLLTIFRMFYPKNAFA